MTKCDLNQLEKLCKEATSGPWFSGDGQPSPCAVRAHGKIIADCRDDVYVVKKEDESGQLFKIHSCRNAEFIAASRTALPELIAEVKSLRAKLEIAREALKEITEGKGRFSKDHFTHAENTIEDMKELAQQALEKIREGKE